MDRHTSKNAEYLDARYRRGVPQGRYFAHEPIYGVGCGYSEGYQAVKLARTYGIFRRLAQMQFDTFLDVGGAEGYHASLAHQLFSAKVITSDLSFQANLRARELFGLPAVASDAHWLPYPDESFDVVLCCEVLEHVADPVAVVCEVARVVRKYAVFSTEQSARNAREREIRLLLADTKSPHSELHWFLPDDFQTVFGKPVAHEREIIITRRLAELYAVGLEPPPDELRDVVFEMTRVGEPTPSDNGMLVILPKGTAPPVDTSDPGSDALLDAIMAYKVEPGELLAEDVSDRLDPFLREKLHCPVCVHPLNDTRSGLRCPTCGRQFEVDQGIPCFHLHEGSVDEGRAGPSRWPWFSDEAAKLRAMFTASRPRRSRLLYYLLSAELSLLDVLRSQPIALDDYASSAGLHRAVQEVAAGAEGPAGPPRSGLTWWDRMPATEVELEAMRRFGAALVALVADLARLRARGPGAGTLRGMLRVVSRLPARARVWLLHLMRRGERHVPARGTPFRDIPSDCWALREVEALAKAGICADRGDALYSPEWATSRGDFAVYIARMVARGRPAVPPHTGAPSFPDVPSMNPAHRYVEYALARGIVSGYPDGLFHPEQFLDRGQAAVLIARATAGGDGNVPEGPGTPTFPDVTPQPDDLYAECYRYVEYLASRGVVRGYPDGLYHPERTCSRDQMAVYLARAFRLAE